MALYNIFCGKRKVKGEILEITCSQCSEIIATENLMTHEGTNLFYHGDYCALNYHVKNPKFSWRDTIQISRVEVLAILENTIKMRRV
jgi:hypothetical protein